MGKREHLDKLAHNSDFHIEAEHVGELPAELRNLYARGLIEVLEGIALSDSERDLNDRERGSVDVRNYMRITGDGRQYLTWLKR